MNYQYWKQPHLLLILIAIMLISNHLDTNHAYGKGKLYWIERDGETLQDKIVRANLNGSNIENVVTGLQAAGDITLDLRNRKMYWITDYASIIQSANLDGSNIENVITGFSFRPGEGKLRITCQNGKCEGIATPKDGKPIKLPHEKLIAPICIAIDENKNNIYWGNDHLDIFQSSNLDGTNIEDFEIRELIVPFNIRMKQWLHPINIEIDSDTSKIYWTDGLASKIQRANLDGSDPEDIITDMRTAYALALDLHDEMMYWSNTVTGKIFRANLNGDKTETLVTGLNFPYDIALDLRAGKMYWLELDWQFETGRIRQSNLDGTDVRDIITNLNSPSGLDLDTEGPYDVSPSSNQLTTTWANMKSK